VTHYLNPAREARFCRSLVAPGTSRLHIVPLSTPTEINWKQCTASLLIMCISTYSKPKKNTHLLAARYDTIRKHQKGNTAARLSYFAPSYHRLFINISPNCMRYVLNGVNSSQVRLYTCVHLHKIIIYDAFSMTFNFISDETTPSIAGFQHVSRVIHGNAKSMLQRAVSCREIQAIAPLTF